VGAVTGHKAVRERSCCLVEVEKGKGEMFTAGEVLPDGGVGTVGVRGSEGRDQALIGLVRVV
jgi:hypothetical protein